VSGLSHEARISCGKPVYRSGGNGLCDDGRSACSCDRRGREARLRGRRRGTTMGSEGPSGEGRTEGTPDWPATPRPAPPSGHQEATEAAPVAPRSLHEEDTLEAARFVRPSQQNPVPQQPLPPSAGPVSQGSGWPHTPAPRQVMRRGSAGAPTTQASMVLREPTHRTHILAPQGYPVSGIRGPLAPPPPTVPATPTNPKLSAAQRLSKYRW
jgi:hypothetical protein